MNDAPRILIVDDEPDVLAALEFRFSREGWEVTTAVDGFEALGKARARQPDLVVLDVMMPGENGYRVSRMLREDQSKGVYPEDLRIVLLTARDLSSQPERHEMFLEFSLADRILYKPFDLEELVVELGQLLELPASSARPVVA